MTVGVKGSPPEWTGTGVPGAIESKSVRSAGINTVSEDGSKFHDYLRESSGLAKPSEKVSKRTPGEKKNSPDSDDALPAITVAWTGMQEATLPITTTLIGLPQSSIPLDETGNATSPGTSSVMSERPTGSSISNLLLTTNNRPIQGKSTKAAEMPLIPPGDKEIDEPEVEKPMPPIDSDPVAVKGSEPGSNVQLQASRPLAFALRVANGELGDEVTKQERQVESVSNKEVEPSTSSKLHLASSSVGTSAVEGAAGSQLEQNAHSREELYQTTTVENLAHRPEAASQPEASSTEVAPTNKAAGTEPEVGSHKAEPVNNVHMQLISDDNRRVDVRLVDRGGELHVSVRSGDMDLTQNLQDHMSDLTSRLQQQHLQSEVWMPKSSEHSAADNSSQKNFTPNGSGGGSASNSDQKRRGQQQQQKPDWVEALESYS